MDASLIDSIIEYRKRLEKGVGTDKILPMKDIETFNKSNHCLLRVTITTNKNKHRYIFDGDYLLTVEMLKETGIGKVVRKISKENDGDVRDKAKHLCSEWRRVVREIPDTEADEKLSEIQASKKIKIERDESPPKVKKYESSSFNGVKTNDAYDPKINWTMKSASNIDEKPKMKPERRLPTVKEVKEAAQRNGVRVASASSDNNQFLGVTSRKVRTTVYSGQARTTQYTHVLRLEELCLRVLMDHVDKITYLGCVPYYIMKPVLKKCTAAQLFKIEDYNPSFVEEDDELWFDHCQSTFKDCEPEEHESWRELYIRCEYERDAKLKQISGKINRQKEQSGPARRTMLFDSVTVKPPRHVQRLQQKHGTAGAVHFPEPGSTGKGNAAAIKAAARESRANPPKKARTAPLMAKSLQLMKTRFRR